LAWRTLNETLNLKFTAKTPMFFSHCYPLAFSFLALAKTYSFAIFGLRQGLSELQMCMALALAFSTTYSILIF
jgi:hypothetical protein